MLSEKGICIGVDAWVVGAYFERTNSCLKSDVLGRLGEASRLLSDAQQLSTVFTSFKGCDSLQVKKAWTERSKRGRLRIPR